MYYIFIRMYAYITSIFSKTLKMIDFYMKNKSPTIGLNQPTNQPTITIIIISANTKAINSKVVIFKMFEFQKKESI